MSETTFHRGGLIGDPAGLNLPFRLEPCERVLWPRRDHEVGRALDVEADRGAGPKSPPTPER